MRKKEKTCKFQMGMPASMLKWVERKKVPLQMSRLGLIRRLIKIAMDSENSKNPII